MLATWCLSQVKFRGSLPLGVWWWKPLKVKAFDNLSLLISHLLTLLLLFHCHGVTNCIVVSAALMEIINLSLLSCGWLKSEVVEHAAVSEDWLRTVLCVVLAFAYKYVRVCVCCSWCREPRRNCLRLSHLSGKSMQWCIMGCTKALYADRTLAVIDVKYWPQCCVLPMFGPCLLLAATF